VNGTTLSICINNTWINTECPYGLICNADRCETAVCAEGESRCVGAAVSTCINGAWVSSECASGQTCSNGKCMGGSAPIEGAPCNWRTYVEQCFGGAAYYCGWYDEVVRWDCAGGGGKCISVENDEAWCAYLDSEAYDQCDYDGQVSIWYPGWAEQLCASDIIIFDSCHMIDGKMYFIEDRAAESVCVENSRVACVSSDTIGMEPCSGTCSFDGWDAVCIAEPCTHGETKCMNSTIVSTCVSGSWVSSECVGGQVCNADKCEAAVCTEGEMKCISSKTMSICRDNAWVLFMTCGGNLVCNAGKCEAAVCAEGEKKCVSGTTASVCIGDSWVDSACASGLICSAGKCETPPSAGSDCDETFKSVCLGLRAFNCNASGKVTEWDCRAHGSCLFIQNDISYEAHCGEKNLCEYDGRLDFGEYPCDDGPDIIYFESCNFFDGNLYDVSRIAGSVCDGDLLHRCEGLGMHTASTCPGGCFFDGWNAVCK